MIQDITPHIFSNHFRKVNEILPDDIIFYFRENKLMLLKKEDEPDLPRRKDICLHEGSKAVFLFSLNENNCFWVDDCPIDDQKFVFEEVNFFRTLKRKETA